MSPAGSAGKQRGLSRLARKKRLLPTYLLQRRIDRYSEGDYARGEDEPTCSCAGVCTDCSENLEQ